MKRILFIALLTSVVAPRAGAQFGSYSASTEPAYWVGFGVSAFNGQGVNDGATQSSWDFGQRTNWQYRASLEKAIQNQSSIGIVGTFVHVPFTYRNSTGLTTPPCASPGCSTGSVGG